MGKINIGRALLGGIVAGIVGDILGYVVDSVLLAPQWGGAMRALGKAEFSVSQAVAFNVIGLVYGILIVWLYAELRPRYGAGPKTAIYAGLAVWVAGNLLPNAAFMWAAHLFPTRLTVLTTAAAIVELVAAALAGAALYKEGTGSAQSNAARA